ncbi:PepSY-like domain-containing protein [Peijinzhouia sedimentorum]
MKKQVLFIIAIGVFSVCKAQDIPQSQVPSIILNQFNAQFPDATDIAWEMERKQYKVEFETGWNKDHELWFDINGSVIKHKEEITKEELPTEIKSKINNDFKGYSIDDLERISEQGSILYKMELNSLFRQDWKMVFDKAGNVVSKTAD